MFGKGNGKRRAVDRVAELTAEVRQLKIERDDAERGELAAVEARDRAEAANVDLARDLERYRQQARAANLRVAEVEQTLQDLRSATENDNATTQNIPLPAPLVVGPVPAAPMPVLPALPDWARANGFTYSRSNGFRVLPTPGPSIKPMTIQEAAREGKLT